MLNIIRLKIIGKKCADIQFKPGLNVIFGNHSSGKTNSIEILRFSLGGNGDHIDSIIFDLIDYTLCQVELNKKIITIKRKISRSGTQLALCGKPIDQVNESTSWEKINTTDWSNKILNEFQIGGKYNRGRNLQPAEISFYQLYNLVYIAQRHWNKIQQGQQDANPFDRRACFEFCLGLGTEQSKKIDVEYNKLKKEKEEVQRKREYFSNLIREKYTLSPEEILANERNLSNSIEILNSKINSAEREEKQIWEEKNSQLKIKLNEIQTEYQELNNDYQKFDTRINSLESLKLKIEQRLESTAFQQDSIHKLMSLPITICPSCFQEIAIEPKINENTCPLCNRTVKIKRSDIKNQREINYLQDTIIEIESEISYLSEEMKKIEEQLTHIEKERNEILNLMRNYQTIEISPRIDILKNLFNEKYEIEKKLNFYSNLKEIWNINKDLNEKIKDFNSKIEIYEEQMKEINQKQDSDKKLNNFAQMYKELLSQFKPTIEEIKSLELSTTDNREKYLPLINGKLYYDNCGAAALILKIVLYHLTLLILYKRKIAKFPPFLIIDTPRQQELQKGEYNKLLTLLLDNSKDCQIILCVSEEVPLNPTTFNKIEEKQYSLKIC